ncbi:MAG: 50S ribosomal protein L4 [Opitutales bacterium]
MKLKLYAADGTEAGEHEVFDFPSFEGDAGVDALRQVIIAIRANRRQGSASTKVRSEVRGSGRKIHRQKGLGVSRAGDRFAVQRRGGGVVFGPKPRSFNKKINRKMKRLALARALFDGAAEGKLSLIEEWKVAEPKTKLCVQVLDKMVPAGRSALLVGEGDAFPKDFGLAARNVARTNLSRAQDLNPLDLVVADKVIFSAGGLDVLLAKLGRGASS